MAPTDTPIFLYALTNLTTQHGDHLLFGDLAHFKQYLQLFIAFKCFVVVTPMALLICIHVCYASNRFHPILIVRSLLNHFRLNYPTIGISTEKCEDNLVKTLDPLNAFGTNHLRCQCTLLSMEITSLLDKHVKSFPQRYVSF